MAGEPSFTIPERPTRHFPVSGGVEYEGGTTFVLEPDRKYATGDLTSLLEAVFSTGPYRWGDFFNLPMPLYLVKDESTTDVFRVSVRNGMVRLHVLPDTESEGLRALYDRLTEQTACEWHVEKRN